MIHFLDSIYIHKLFAILWLLDFCCEWNLCIDVFQEMVSDETELAVEPEKQMELCGEPKSPSASKEKLSVVLLSVKQEEEGESYSGTSFKSMEDGKDDCSHLLFMILPS